MGRRASRPDPAPTNHLARAAGFGLRSGPAVSVPGVGGDRLGRSATPASEPLFMPSCRTARLSCCSSTYLLLGLPRLATVRLAGDYASRPRRRGGRRVRDRGGSALGPGTRGHAVDLRSSLQPGPAGASPGRPRSRGRRPRGGGGALRAYQGQGQPRALPGGALGRRRAARGRGELRGLDRGIRGLSGRSARPSTTSTSPIPP